MAAPVVVGAGAAWARSLLNWARPERLLASCSISLLSNIQTRTYLQNVGRWEKKNRIVYPPQLPGEPRRPAEIFHCRRDIKYSKDKMWYLAKLIKGMSIDQALAQLEFNDKKGAKVIKEVLLEAQEMAVRNHNVEFKSNLYIADSFSGKGHYLKRIRYHGREGMPVSIWRILEVTDRTGTLNAARLSSRRTENLGKKFVFGGLSVQFY
ncbi:39S ribosomal protein L22, mitochondrial isoform X2 [Chelonia mydas]|uniref:39S ribosomal protein L22, mitochondrial isoform X2 n=1 Tax=Chelonia mydas TaxID=8469 RepID=UPI0018A24528|nr:39S ribosomal protein L22, mitochondrial isoform X2 [Chelonia mydas]